MNVVLYARVSTGRQAEKELSIPDQIRQLRDYCQKQGYAIIKEYREEGASATDDKRPIFQDMIAEVLDRKSNIRAILVLTTSRFFRDATLARIYKHKLKKNGVKVIAIAQKVSEDPGGELLEYIFEAVDQYESRMNAFHTLRGMRENARRGFYNGGIPPYGYRREKVLDQAGNIKSKLKINPEEASTVKLIFGLYINGIGQDTYMGAKSIANYLNVQGHKNRNNRRWDKQAILNILSNRIYMGEFVFNRTGKDGVLKPVQKLRQQRDLRRSNPAVLSRGSLLSGLLKCGKCGASMTLETAKGGHYRYYNCRNFLRLGKNVCEGQRMSQTRIEKEILSYFGARLFTEKRVKELLSSLFRAYQAHKRGREKEVKSLESQIQDIDVRLQNLYSAIEKGTVEMDDVGERVRELKVLKAQLLHRLSDSDRLVNIPLYFFTHRFIKTFRRKLNSLFSSEESGLAKRYLRLLVEKIVLTGNTVHIVGKTRKILELAIGEKTLTVPTAVIDWLPT